MLEHRFFTQTVASATRRPKKGLTWKGKNHMRVNSRTSLARLSGGHDPGTTADVPRHPQAAGHSSDMSQHHHDHRSGHTGAAAVPSEVEGYHTT